MKIIEVLCLLALVLPSGVAAQSSKKEAKEAKKEAGYQEAIQLIQSASYEFTGRKANPQKGRQIDLTTRDNYLRVSGENASADMPYFGRAFNVGYSSSDGGIQFDGPMESSEVQLNDKKRRIMIKFEVKSPDDRFSCTIILSTKENATLTVSSNKRQVISYYGSIAEMDKQEE